MFQQKKPNINETALKMQIDKLFEKLNDHDPQSEEYATVSARVQELYKLREVDGNVNHKRRESDLAWAGIGANLLGILVIVGYEQRNVLTTKALGMLRHLP